MNYIGLINNFWKVDIEYSFTGNETKLYMFLLHTSNSLGWKNPFRLSYRQIELGANLTVNTVKSARNKLKQAGLIDFKEGRRGSAKDIGNKAVYEIGLSKSDNLGGNPEGNQTYPLADSSPEDIDKPETIDADLNLKSATPGVLFPEVKKSGECPPSLTPLVNGKKEKSCAKKESEELCLPHASERFRLAWRQLAANPKWAKKSRNSLQLALNQLARFDEEYAVSLVELAAANDWQGVVFPDSGEKYLKWKASRNAPVGYGGGKLNVANHDNSRIYEDF